MKLFARAPLLALVLTATLGERGAAAEATTSYAEVPSGAYRPLFPRSPREAEIGVPAFRIDRTPVTNAQFLAFVRANPSWARGHVAALLAEPRYLARWRGAEELGPDADPEQPVVEVSWFAARAYCVARGARLPTEAEWERAAAAGTTRADGASDPAFRAELLAIYSRPAPAKLPRVGGAPNFFGVRDLHGLVWEWVNDFGDAVAGFAAGADRLRFCGATAGAASDATDFAAFERTALRSSLAARFVLKNLGFRCAADATRAP
ncbi:MAG TPA: formylglycine-generating enzyme family protein [Labilithrix sp.]|jgi:formylglycine-generating enzyme required for sulfatase activity